MKPQKIRLPHEDALIETLAPAIITWGLHNDICTQHAVGAGFRFNTHEMIGSWHDIEPLTDSPLPFRRIGHSIAADDVDTYNKKNRIISRLIYRS